MDVSDSFLNKLVNTIKNFFGLFNVNSFEKDLLLHVEDKLTPEGRIIWQDQMKRFNRVERIIVDDERLKCGSTNFYRIKWGKSQVDDFPKKFDYQNEEEQIAVINIVSKNTDIKAIFWIVDGVFFTIQYYSKQRIFQPKGPYEITSVEAYR